MAITEAKEKRTRAVLSEAERNRISHGVGLAEAKNRLSALTAYANETGTPFVILKSGSPWVEVRPLAISRDAAGDSITITPMGRSVEVKDVDSLFSGYAGGFTPQEDAFASPVGCEEL